MKILVIGLDSAQPEILFGNDNLENLRRLMGYGCYGRLAGENLESKETAWVSLLTSRPAGQFPASSPEFSRLASPLDDDNEDQWVWSPIRSQGKQAIIQVSWEIAKSKKNQLIDSVYAGNRKVFDQAREFVQGTEWEFLLLVDQGLDQLHQAEFSGFLDQGSTLGYYLHLDTQIGALLELLDDETVVLVVSPYGSPPLNGTNGSFILASSNNPLLGVVNEVNLLEIAPTLLELGGYPIPQSMQGISLVAGKALELLASQDLSAEEEAFLRERLSGLGYIS